MKIRALRLQNVKRFAGRGVAIENIGDGVNVLSAANEFGKSTCFDALHALFFQPHSGTPNSVQMLRPYSGGNPLVEVDIEIEAGTYRLTKQFYSGRSARVVDLGNNRLVAQADEAESFIADLTRGGAGGPAGLLWVRQGLTGIEKRAKAEEETDRRVRETLLSSVQGEVETLTGGRRMAEIIAACDEALLRLVTSNNMKPKAGGPYREALDERDRLQALEQQLASDVTALRDALDRRRTLSRRLAEIEAPAQIEARKRALAEAEEAYQAARSHTDTLRAAEADLALATEQHRTAATSLEAFDVALARAEQLERLASAAGLRLDQARARHAGAQAETDRLQAAMDAAEAADRQARQDKSRLDAAQAARDAAERFAAANAQLIEAQSIRTRIETGEALLTTLQVPQQALDQLEQLDLELARLRVLQQVSLPVLRMEYAEPSGNAVSLAGQPLAHNIELGFSGTVDLDIANIGRLTIRSQHVDNAAQTIATAEARFAELLTGIGVESLAAARQRQNLAREQSNALALDRQLLGQLAPEGIERLRETVTRLDVLRGDGLELKFDAAAIIAALQEAEVAVLATRNAVREAQPVLTSAHREFVDASSDQAQLLAELRSLEGVLGDASIRPEKRQQTARKLEACLHNLAAFETIAAPLRAKAQDLAAVELSLTRLRAVSTATAQEIAQIKEHLADLNGEIRTHADKAIEENWQETKDLLAAASERAMRYEIEVKTLDRLRKALATARSTARDLYLKPVINELRPLVGLLFDDITIAFSEDTLLPQSVRRNGQDEDVDRLSGGMREQLSVLTRLAFARLLARDGRAAPVILDDALVYSDDARIERMFEALHRQSKDQQILVFSCRQRAFSQLGGNVLTMRDWTPA